MLSKFQSYFSESPIRRKMTLVIVGVTLITLFVANVSEMLIDYSMVRSEANRRLQTLAELEARNLIDALDFLDAGEAEEVLRSLELESVIHFACLYDADGNLFVDFYLDNTPFPFPDDNNIERCPAHKRWASVNNTFNSLSIMSLITLNDAKIGYLYMKYDLTHVHFIFLQQEMLALAIILAALLLSYFMASHIQKLILKPVYHLAEIAANFSDEEDYSVRATKFHDDEFGVLVDTFNRMLQGIEERGLALVASKEDAERSKEEADNANAMKGDFLATMSHEIRTPMNGVIGMTELLLDTKLTHKQRNYAQTVINSADALLNIINDILDFSKIEAGKLELEPIPFDLMQVVEDTAELLSIKAHEKAVELIVRYVPGTPQYLIGDPGRIRQVISNLVGNAVKFTDKGYVLITVEEDPDSFLSDGKRKVKVSVKDTGVGIPAEAQNKLFQKFTQADASTTRKFGGTGLGLAICKQLSGMMGGEVGLESVESVGSTFWFTMSLYEDRDADKSIAALGALQNVRVLIVDDILINGQLLEERFQALGMRTTYLADPKKAMSAIYDAMNDSDPYQMAVLDYLMPDLNGEELACMIKDDPQTQGMALIMLTSAGGKGCSGRFEDAGFSSFLSKPIRVAELSETMALVWQEFSRGNTDKLISIEHFKNKKKQGADVSDDIQFKNVNILLAEDNRTNQAFAQEVLESANCQISIAVNGKEAVSLLSKNGYDLVFMDCEMPEMNGFEAATIINEMKKENVIADVPIVALTANAMKGDRERCLDAGMCDYLAKPMRKITLLEMVKKHLPDKVDVSSFQVEGGFGGCKVLLVEDNRTNRMMAEENLTDLGFVVDVAENGQIAVDAVKQNKYDLILMDCQMPVMDGYEATGRICDMIKDGSVDKMPIIALTANAMKGDRQRCLDAGMCDYITKPLRKAELIEAISRWLAPVQRDVSDSNGNESMFSDDLLVLDEELLSDYREVMGQKFSFGVESFLQDTRLLVNHLKQSFGDKNLMEIHSSVHSLKSSAAIMGAMELSFLSQRLEGHAGDLLKNKGSIEGLAPNVVDEIEMSFRRVAPLLDEYIKAASKVA